MRILQQVQQRLLDLRQIDAAFDVGIAHLQLKADLAPQSLQEAAPAHRLQLRLGQLGETRIAADEAFQMERAIKSGSYKPDERLPTELDLAAEFEVSRPIVRDALKRLREQGLIYSRRGAGSLAKRA